MTSSHPKADEDEAAQHDKDVAAIPSSPQSSRLPMPCDVPSWDGAFEFSKFNKADVVSRAKGWGNGKRVGVPGFKQYSPLDNFSVSSHWIGSCWQLCFAKPLFWWAFLHMSLPLLNYYLVCNREFPLYRY